MNASLIPPKHPRPPFRQQALFALIGAIAGAIIGSVAWSFAGTPIWFWAVPMCALLGLWASHERPNVFWFNRDN